MTETTRVQIGWYVQEEQEVTQNPTTYAADWERVRLTPGRYPMMLEFGRWSRWPQTLFVAVAGVRVDGAMYAGFAGVNYGSTPLKAGEPMKVYRTPYGYFLRQLVAEGKVILDAAWDDLLEYGSPGEWACYAGVTLQHIQSWAARS